jgi:hypothetical protein
MGNTRAIKDDTVWILAEIERLRSSLPHRGLDNCNFIMDQYLDSLTADAESVIGDVTGSDDGTDNTEPVVVPAKLSHNEAPDSLPEQANKGSSPPWTACRPTIPHLEDTWNSQPNTKAAAS